MKQKTTHVTDKEISRDWYLVDAADMVLGRVASEVAALLIGKSKVARSPNVDAGDHVVVINSDKVILTGEKGSKKEYFRHSGYPGGAKTITFDKQMEKDSRFVIEKAVKNMLPKNKLQDGRFNRLHVFAGKDHKHSAQNPVIYKLSAQK